MVFLWEANNTYNFVRDTKDGYYYLDYIVNISDLNDFSIVSYDFEELKGIIDSTLDKFSELVDGSCKLKILSYYNGDDMFVDY